MESVLCISNFNIMFWLINSCVMKMKMKQMERGEPQICQLEEADNSFTIGLIFRVKQRCIIKTNKTSWN